MHCAALIFRVAFSFLSAQPADVQMISSYILFAATVFIFLHVLLALLGAHLIGRCRRVPESMDEYPFVSVLVAARDEEEMIPLCLNSLCAQDYPADRVEFLIVDDHSTDSTPEIIRQMAESDRRIRYLKVLELDNLAGKAAALHTAVLESRGDLLVVTDADCTPPSPWIRNLVSRLLDSDDGMLCGVTAVSHHDLFTGVQALDWTLLLATAAAASEARFPITGMGNNMCIRKSVYDEVGGYPGIPASVTEDYALFRAVNRTKSWKARLCLDPYLVNFTAPVKNIREVWQQRRRWAAGGLQAHPVVRLLLAVIFLAQLFPVAALFFYPIQALGLLFLKAIGDAVMIRTAQKKLRVHVPFRYFPVFELILILYLILLPFSLLIAPKIAWKGRTYGRRSRDERT